MFERLIEFFREFRDALLPFFVVDSWERSLVLRFGVFHRECPPGFHWRIPGVDRVISHSVVASVHALKPQSLSTKDGHACVISAIVTWRVNDLRKLLLEVEDAQHALLDASHGIIAAHVSGAGWADVVTSGFLDLAHLSIRKRAFKWGMEVLQVQFCDLQRCKSLRIWQ